MIEDLPGRYAEYLERFTREVGELEVGKFAKYRGKLIKKLGFEEFTPAYLEYTEVSDQYFASLQRGDTVNDMVLRMLREQALSLVLAPP
jgi:hypothetical protein